MIKLWIVLTLVGLISNLLFQYQCITAVLIDAIIVCPRFILGYLATEIFLTLHNIKISDSFEQITKVVITFLFLLAIHDIVFWPFFEKSDFRYIMYSIKLLFPHPTFLSCAAATMLILLGYKNKENDNILFMFMASFLCVVTMRSKAIGFVLVYWMAYFYFQIAKKKNILLLGIVGCVVAIISSWEIFSLTFLIADRFSPRSILLKDSLKLLVKHLPLGTGFGTYGSAVAANYYSPIYEDLGYINFSGMNPNDTMFLMDSFWPIIFAQFGIIGTFIFVYIIVIFIKKCIKKFKTDRKAGMAMLMVMIYMFIISIAEAAFFGPTALLMFMLFAVFEKGN
ncbi:MAG: hypothetical protein PUE95_01020 [Lachnospiraceae bacterium]|nr:hypothetical protein [Lachnospiraceae bacterium]